MREDFKLQLLQAIPVGEESALHRAELATMLDVKPETIKQAIRELRTEDGKIICSSRNGYFFPKNDKEIRRYYELESKQAITRLSSILNVRRYLAKDPRQETFAFLSNDNYGSGKGV